MDCWDPTTRDAELGKFDKPEEKAACLVAEAVLGVRFEKWDDGTAPRRVDALLQYEDGRRGAFEVMWLAVERDMRVDRQLDVAGGSWPTTGTGRWTLFMDPTDMPDDRREKSAVTRLRKIYNQAILACEAQGVQDPSRLSDATLRADPELRWLAREARSDLRAWPADSARQGSNAVLVTQRAVGGAVDDHLLGLRPALEAAFDDKQAVRHFKKLRDVTEDVSERHLFLPIDYRKLPFPVLDELVNGTALPPDRPPVPEHVSHLWLAPALGGRVLLWSAASGWSQHHPYGARTRDS